MSNLEAKERIRRFFLANIGNVVTSIQGRDASGTGVSEWVRRVRELRKQDRWPILTHNDSANLKPGQFLLNEAPPDESAVKFSRSVSAKLRAAVLDRKYLYCEMCGMTPGEIDPDTGRRVRLHIGQIKDTSLGGEEELMNLRALCSRCNQGAKYITAEKPTTIWLLSQIRRAGRAEQLAVLKCLRKKFDH